MIGDMLRCMGRWICGVGTWACTAIGVVFSPILTPLSIFKIRWKPSLSSEVDPFAGACNFGEGLWASTTGGAATSSCGAKIAAKRDFTGFLGSCLIGFIISCSALLVAGVLQNPKNLSTLFSTTAGAVCGSTYCISF